MSDPWLSAMSRPWTHLVSTVAVFSVLIACVVLSVSFPQWMTLLGIVGALPVVLWYLFMMKAYRALKAPWLATQGNQGSS